MSQVESNPYGHLPFSAFWEHGYQDARVSTMGGPNHDIVELCAALPAGARVLDLGCGEGRNSFYLASRGCRVTAVDRSKSGIEKLRALSERTGIPVVGVVSDIVDYPLEGEWDLVMAHGVIDYLDNAQWKHLLANVKAHTAPGGFNSYTCMLFTDEYPAGPEFDSAGFKHSVAQFEFAGFYGDWEMIRHDRYVKWDQHPGIPLHCHPVDKVTARRPGSGAKVRVEPVPIGDATMPRPVFDTIDMGISAAELLSRGGQPMTIDTFTMQGPQLGVGPTFTVDGYSLSLWYYGRAVIYVVNGTVWGRALYTSVPIRTSFA